MPRAPEALNTDLGASDKPLPSKRHSLRYSKTGRQKVWQLTAPIPIQDFQVLTLPKKVEYLRSQSADYAYLLLTQKMLPQALAGDKQDTRLATAYGITFDKAALNIEGSDLILKIPAPLIEAFQVLITAKTVDKSPKKPVDILKTEQLIGKPVDSSVYEK